MLVRSNDGPKYVRIRHIRQPGVSNPKPERRLEFVDLHVRSGQDTRFALSRPAEDGGPESTPSRSCRDAIMKIGDWKTRSGFERYAIVSQSDIQDGMTRPEAGQQQENAETAQEQNEARNETRQGLGRIAHGSTDSHNNCLPIIPRVNWLFSGWVGQWLPRADLSTPLFDPSVQNMRL